MGIMLDTHAFLWIAYDSPELSDRARSIFLDPSNEFLLSLVSVWEMAIKCSIGKLNLGQPLRELVNEALTRRGILMQGLEIKHVFEVQSLPFHHRDPFDRLLIAQATVEGHRIMSRDRLFDTYGIQRIW